MIQVRLRAINRTKDALINAKPDIVRITEFQPCILKAALLITEIQKSFVRSARNTNQSDGNSVQSLLDSITLRWGTVNINKLSRLMDVLAHGKRKELEG